MHKILTILFLLFSILHTKEIKPIATITVSGLVSDFAEDAGKTLKKIIDSKQHLMHTQQNHVYL